MGEQGHWGSSHRPKRPCKRIPPAPAQMRRHSRSAQAQHRPARHYSWGRAQGRGLEAHSALAPKGRGGRTCVSWAVEEGRGDAGVIIEKVPERSKTSGCGRRLGVVRRRNSVRL